MLKLLMLNVRFFFLDIGFFKSRKTMFLIDLRSLRKVAGMVKNIGKHNSPVIAY